MTIETLPFERRPRNSIANNLDKINELVDWVNLDTHLYASASGERVTVDDASSLKGLTVDGRSVQDGTPTPDAPVPVQVVEGANLLPVTTQTRTMNGVTATVNADGSVSLSGTSTAEGDIYIYGGWQASSVDFDLTAGSSYTLSITPIVSGVVAKIYTFTSEETLIGGSTTNPATGFITIRAAENAKRVGFSIRVASGVNVDGVTVRVQFEHGSEATPYVPYGSIGIVVGAAATPINLQGNTLASLPDGTRDELHIDSAGHCVLTKNVGKYVVTGQENGSTEQVNNYYRFYSSVIENMQAPLQAVQGNTNGYCTHSQYVINYNGQYVHAYVVQTKRFLVFSTNTTPLNDFINAELYYQLATPQTIDLGYIDPPAIPSGSVVTVSASLTPTLHLEWWMDDGITTLVNDLIAYIDYKTEG